MYSINNNSIVCWITSVTQCKSDFFLLADALLLLMIKITLVGLDNTTHSDSFLMESSCFSYWCCKWQGDMNLAVLLKFYADDASGWGWWNETKSAASDPSFFLVFFFGAAVVTTYWLFTAASGSHACVCAGLLRDNGKVQVSPYGTVIMSPQVVIKMIWLVGGKHSHSWWVALASTL